MTSLISNITLHLVPFGEKITSSDVVLVAIDRLASQCTKLKARYIKKTSDGVETEKTGNLSYILKSKPNSYMTPYEFIYKVAALLMLNDNAFIYPLFNKQTLELEVLYPLNPSMVDPIVDEANSYYLKFYFKDGKNYILPKDNTIHSILLNEKYKGDALLQEKFTVDFLSHKTKVNEGEIPQYYVHDSRPTIIPKEERELVQVEIYRRKHLGYEYSYVNPFFSKLIWQRLWQTFWLKNMAFNRSESKKSLSM